MAHVQWRCGATWHGSSEAGHTLEAPVALPAAHPVPLLNDSHVEAGLLQGAGALQPRHSPAHHLAGTMSKCEHT